VAKCIQGRTQNVGLPDAASTLRCQVPSLEFSLAYQNTLLKTYSLHELILGLADRSCSTGSRTSD